MLCNITPSKNKSKNHNNDDDNYHNSKPTTAQFQTNIGDDS